SKPIYSLEIGGDRTARQNAIITFGEMKCFTKQTARPAMGSSVATGPFWKWHIGRSIAGTIQHIPSLRPDSKVISVLIRLFEKAKGLGLEFRLGHEVVTGFSLAMVFQH